MSKSSDIMGRAKAALVLENAFFASIICNLPLIESATTKYKTMETNGKWVKYDPDFVEGMSFAEVKFVLCHEVGHCIFQHMFRRGERDPTRWNQAGDYIINNMLIDAKIGEMPSRGLHNAALVLAGGGTTDGVYNLLPEGNEDGSGNGHGDPMDDCQDAEGSEAEQSEAEAEMKVMVAQAAQAARMCGHMTAELQRLVDETLKPRVDWKDVLRRFVAARAKVERSYARPSRRFLGEGLYMPSLMGEAMGEILIGLDVSGSISAEEVGAFFAELRGIKEDVNPRVIHVEYFHHEIAHYDKFEQDEELEMTRTGSGGTRFSPIFSYAEEMGIDPVCCVVLTDLECNDFGPPPAYPVLWITTGREQAEFGEIVRMDPSA